MNLIRLIKLKKINGELDDLTEQEKFFLSFFDDLDIQHYNNDIDLIKNDVVYFSISLENKKFYYSYFYVFMVFKSKYDMNEMILNSLINGILENHLNLSGFTTKGWQGRGTF